MARDSRKTCSVSAASALTSSLRPSGHGDGGSDSGVSRLRGRFFAARPGAGPLPQGDAELDEQAEPRADGGVTGKDPPLVHKQGATVAAHHPLLGGGVTHAIQPQVGAEQKVDPEQRAIEQPYHHDAKDRWIDRSP
jgi:hypothetical protein